MTPLLLNTLSIVAIGLWVAFSLLAGWIGYLKGIYKTAVKTGLKAIIITVAIFTCPGIANAVGNINIQGILGSATPMTIHSWIVQWIIDYFKVSPINGMSLYETFVALTNSALAYGIFFIFMILTQILIVPLTALVYHGFFHWFLHVETRKEEQARKHKKEEALKAGLADDEGKIQENPKKKLPRLKWWAAGLGFSQELVFIFILLCPVTAIASTAISNKESVHSVMEVLNTDENTISMVDSYVDAVESSPLYAIWHAVPLDNVIMNKVSSVKLSGGSVSLNGLLSSAFDVADPLLDSGSISYDTAAGQITISFSSLLAVSTVDSLISAIVENPMVVALIPPFIDIAVNSVNLANISADDLDFSNIDWSSELTIVKSVYSNLYQTFVSPAIKDDGLDFSDYEIKTSSMSDEEIKKIGDALESLADMEVLKKNLPSLMASIGNYMESINLSILPTDSSVYDDVDWGHDLSLLGTTVLKFFRMMNTDLSVSVDLQKLMDATFESLGDNTKRSQMLTLINGDSETEGLLDLTAFKTFSISEILDSALSSVTSLQPYLKTIDVPSLLADYTISDYKREMKTVFDMAGILFVPESKISIDNLASFDLNDDETVDELVTLLNTSLNSQLFTKLYPKILKSFLFHSSFDFSDFLFGLTPYNFNYDSDDFIDNFKELITLLPDIKSFTSLLSDDSKTIDEKIKALDTDLIKDLLSLIVNSDLFNSEVRTGVTSVKQKNINIHTLLSNLCNNETFSSIGLSVPSIDDLQSIQWNDQDGEEGEISLLCNMIDGVKANSSFITGDKDTSKIVDYDALGQLLKSGFKSKIVSPSILKIIDQSLNQYLKKVGIQLNMNEMRTSLWIDDCDRIVEALRLFNSISLEDIDLNTLDVDEFNAVLTLLNKCNFILTSNTSPDPFGYTIYNLIASLDIFTSIGMKMPEPSVFILSDISQWSLTTDTKTLSSGLQITYTSSGEIYELCHLVKVLQSFLSSGITEGKLPEGFSTQITSCLNSNFIRKIFVLLMDKMMSNVKFGGSFSTLFNSVDFSLFETMSLDQIKKEMKLFDLISEYAFTLYNDETELVYMLSHIATLNTCVKADGKTTLLDDFVSLLDAISDSQLLTTVKDRYLLSPLGSFFKSIITTLSLTDKVTLVSTSQSAALQSILLNVVDWGNEIDLLKDVVIDLQGLDVSNLDLSSASLDLSKSSSLLNSMNQSAVFHRVPIALLKMAFASNNIDSLIADPETGKVVHPLNWNVHLSTSLDDIAFWKNDIDNSLELIMGENGLSSIFKNNTTLESLSLADLPNFYFLYYLGQINVLKENRSYFVYNLMDKCAGDSFSLSNVLSASEIAPYGENKNVYRLEELFYQNDKLMVVDASNNKVMSFDKAKHDLDMLKSVLVNLLSNVSTIATTNDLSKLNFDFEDICNATIDFSDGVNTYSANNYYRSDLTSEIVAGVMKQLVNNSLFDGYLTEARKLDFYADSFSLINPIEGKGINGLISMMNLISTLSTTKTYFTYNELTEVFSSLGSTDASIAKDMNKFNCFISSSDYRHGNSRIIMTVPDSTLLAAVIVLKKGEAIPSSLSSVIDSTTYNSSYYSYSEILASVKNNLN